VLCGSPKMGIFLTSEMKFIRLNINIFNKLATCGFAFSWLLTAIMLPVVISLIADSHTTYSVFNAEEGCYELVVDHHENTDDFHVMDESNGLHSFHTSCCFDDLALTFKKDEADHQLPLFFFSTEINFSLVSEQIPRPVAIQVIPLPAPVSVLELRVTRLLI